jgi:hypothetical protein
MHRESPLVREPTSSYPLEIDSIQNLPLSSRPPNAHNNDDKSDPQSGKRDNEIHSTLCLSAHSNSSEEKIACFSGVIFLFYFQQSIRLFRTGFDTIVNKHR